VHVDFWSAILLESVRTEYHEERLGYCHQRYERLHDHLCIYCIITNGSDKRVEKTAQRGAA
jgi:hypothetical protein